MNPIFTAAIDKPVLEKKIRILFPSDYFDVKKVEPDYQEEYDAVSLLPIYEPIFFNYDEFVSGSEVKLYPKDAATGLCIYRGWMLTPVQYKELYDSLLAKGITLINSPEQYNACHLFSNVYDSIEQFTPKCLFFAQGTVIDWALVNKTFKRFMVKDYVKSVKGSDFPAYFETPVDPAEMDRRINEFIELRGDLFTGGIALKEFVELKKYGNTTNEHRVFYIYGNKLSIGQNSDQLEGCGHGPDIVPGIGALKSNYYTVDFAELLDGTSIVIETGDGQVSGLPPGQDMFMYYYALSKRIEKTQEVFDMLDKEQKGFLLKNAGLIYESATEDLFNKPNAMLWICLMVYGEECQLEADDDPRFDCVRLSLAEQIMEIIYVNDPGDWDD